MRMKTIDVELTGTGRGLLMHNIEGADLDQTTRKTLKTYDPKEEAEKSVYRIPGKKELCVPDRCIFGMLSTAASYFKIKGRSVKPIIGGAVRVEPEFPGLGVTDYEIDRRSVVIQRNRVMRSRPRLSKWKLKFKLLYNDEYIPEPNFLKNILEEAGVKVGL